MSLRGVWWAGAISISLRTEAKALDRESESPTRDCEEDLQRYCMLICGRIIGGQSRELTGKDLAFMEQIFGLKIVGADFAAIAAELRSRPAAELDTIVPELHARPSRSRHPCSPRTLRRVRFLTNRSGSEVPLAPPGLGRRQSGHPYEYQLDLLGKVTYT